MFASGFATRDGDGDHDKECKWKQLLISRILEAGLQTCFWLLCDERCSFRTKLDGPGRAFRQTPARVPWSAALRATHLILGLCTPTWRPGLLALTVTTHCFWAPGYSKCRKKKAEKAAQWAQGGESVSCMAGICSSKSMRAWHGRDYTFSKDASQFSGTREAMPGQQGWGSQRPRVDDLGAQGRRPDTAQNKNESVFLRFLAAF